MKLGYYPGCTLKTKARNLEEAAIRSMAALGYDMVELDRWNCCGAVYSLADDDLVHLLAPVRDLIRAHDQGYEKVITLCSMCYNTLARANLLMRSEPVKRDAINNFLEEENSYIGEVEVLHLLSFIRDEIGWDKFRSAIKHPLEGLKLAPYYGCTLTRPRDVSIEQGVTPVLFKDFIESIGATYIPWDEAEVCCGSYQIISNPEAAESTVGRLVKAANRVGADAMILSCPLCEYNVGQKQAEIIKSQDIKAIPTYYFSQLLAVALGLDPQVGKFNLNTQAARELLNTIGLAQVV